MAKKQEQQQQDCVICLDCGRNWITLPCGHQYHRTCIRDWTLRTPRCPLCWEEVVVIDMPPDQERERERDKCCAAALVALTWLSISSLSVVAVLMTYA